MRSALIAVAACAVLAGPVFGEAAQPRGAGMPMEKVVSKEAHFALYKPVGWVVHEGVQPTFRTLAVADPGGLYEAAFFYGTNPTGGDILALARTFVSGIGRQFPDLVVPGVMVSPDRKQVVFDAQFTAPQKGKRQFRCWVTGGRGAEFMYASIEAPAGQLVTVRPLLLTILANIRVIRGAFDVRRGPAPIEVQLVPYRLSDGSASFRMPQGWRVQEFGGGCFLAGDGTGGYSFIVASLDMITPQLGVTFPGAIVSSYLPPHRALAFLGRHQGVLTNMQFLEVIPRADVAQQMSMVYTLGPIQAEEFFHTCTTRGGRCKGYTFGFSLGSRLGTNWNFRHLTVLAPVEAFDRFLGNFVAMLQSYRINDQWAQNYVAQGMARLRRLQQQTSAMVARNAQEIRQMMQAAYDERQRSMDYIDYQRTSYIRGQQDWISAMEGGTVYHTDSWGTKNTVTGDYHEGKPYNYVHFTGKNPQYNEQMQAVDSRQLWERHIQ